jgi:subtilisin family serine protease
MQRSFVVNRSLSIVQPAPRADRFAYLRWFLVAALATAVVFAGAGPAWGQASAAAAYEPKIAKGQILVGKKKGSARADFDAAVNSQGAHSIATISNIDVDIVSVPAGKERDVVTRLKGNKHVEFAELDQLMPAAATVNDPSYASEWHLAKIGAPQAWDYTTGGGVIIAILDTGVDGTHPDLAPQMVAGWNFYDNNSNTADIQGHGTAVAGTAAAAANNAIGVAGVAGGAKIMPLRISDPSAWAAWSTTAQAINYAADHGARVVNLSYVGTSVSSTILTAASYLRSKGGVMFVAAGNNGVLDNTAPTTVLQVVSATQESDQLASWSTYGPFVSISAPGNNILTTSRGGIYQYWWGTSLATPVVAGTAALIIAKRPDFTPAQIDATLKSTATDLGSSGTDNYFGAGRVNAAAALALAAGGSAPLPTDTTAPTVAITSPTSGTMTGTVTVSTTAGDNVGVTKVELRANGTLVATDTAAPYTFSWNTTTSANGGVNLTAVAYDAAGNKTTSGAVYVTVSNTTGGDTTPPAIVITAPTAGSTVTGQVTVSANASDNVGVTRVDFKINATVVATTNTAPYRYTWTTTQFPNGGAMLTAVAYDAAGNSSTSVAVGVTVSNAPSSSGGDVSPPQVVITSPLSGNVTGVVPVAVSATDNVGVTRVDLKVNGSIIGSLTSAPYQFSWNTAGYPDGVATLVAVAYDAAGNVGTSSTVAVNVAHPSSGGADSTPPVITLRNPVSGALVSGPVQISATATDNSGAAGITMTVYVDGVMKATATGGSINYNWNAKKAAPGLHTLMVAARDAAGNGSTAQVQVTRK